MDAKLLKVGLLLYLGEDKNHNGANEDNIELEGIDVSKWNKRKRL